MNSWRTLVGGVVVLVLAGLGVGMFWQAAKASPWRSNPVAVRPWSPRATLFKPPAPNPVAPTDTNPPVLTYTTNQDAVTARFHVPRLNKCDPFLWQIVPSTNGTSADLGCATLNLRFLAVGYGAPSQGHVDGWSIELPGQFFHADGSAVRTGELDQAGVSTWDRAIHYGAGFPSLKLFVESTHMDQVRVLGVRVFDARTRAPLESGSTSQSVSDRFTIETGLSLWHSSPMEVVLEVAAGPATTLSFPATAGSLLPLPCGGSVMLVGVFPGHSVAHSTSHNATNSVITVTTRLNASKPETTLAFRCDDYEHGRPFDLVALDRLGKPVPPAGGSSSGGCVLQSYGAAPEDIATIQVRFFPNLRRVIFHLPGPPGLPEGNKQVANLFDVAVPWLQFQHEDQVRTWLEKVLQLRINSRRSPTFAPSAFPLTLTNTTPAEVLGIFLRACPPGTIARVDPSKQELLIGSPTWRNWAQNVWFKVRSLF